MIVPFTFVMMIPNLTSISARFILQSMVDDKQTKMRETLRLMSLSRGSYAFSFILFQGIFAILSGILLTVFVFDYEYAFPYNGFSRSIGFMIGAILFCIAQIPFAMALSTVFNDSKVGNQVGGLFIILPIVLFLQVSQ